MDLNLHDLQQPPIQGPSATRRVTSALRQHLPAVAPLAAYLPGKRRAAFEQSHSL